MLATRHLRLALSIASVISVASTSALANWPSFRGPNGAGTVAGAKPPIDWDVATGHNVAWKTPIPGLGLGGCVVWGDRAYVTTAVSAKKDDNLRVGLYGEIKSVDDDSVHEWRVYCLDRDTGKVRWQQTAHKGVPKIKRHTKSSHANTTPATDGTHVVAFFGSEGLHCYDMDGKRLWSKDLGLLDSGYYVVPAAQWEFASSPIIHNGRVIVQCDVQGSPFVAAFDVRDGKELWRVERTEVPTWSTPSIYEHDGKTRVVVNGYRHIGAYDVATGAEVWKMHGGGDIPVPTPVVAGNLIYITNAHGGGAPLYAIRTSATGDISLDGDATTNAHIAWADLRSGAYMQTPVVVGNLLYSCRDNGVVMCYDAATGEQVFRHRLGGGITGFTASAVAADGMLYYTSEEGDVTVMRAGREPDVVATNSLGEVCMSTPALSGEMILFHTRGHMIAIAPDKKAAGGAGDLNNVE